MTYYLATKIAKMRLLTLQASLQLQTELNTQSMQVGGQTWEHLVECSHALVHFRLLAFDL
jgi:hypothetical protein